MHDASLDMLRNLCQHTAEITQAQEYSNKWVNYITSLHTKPKGLLRCQVQQKLVSRFVQDLMQSVLRNMNSPVNSQMLWQVRCLGGSLL